MVTRRRAIAGGVVVVGLVVGITVAMYHFAGKEPVAPTVGKEPVITRSTDSPSESKAEAKDYNWQGSASEPKKISIPRLNVDAYIQKSGVDQNRQIAVPSNVHLASWFADSVVPGNRGLSIIAGHVSGKRQPGVFIDLGKLIKGDEFSVVLGDNTQKTFQVMSVASVPTDQAADRLFSQDPTVKRQLHLVTCAGRYDAKVRSYDKRVIVAAKLKDS